MAEVWVLGSAAWDQVFEVDHLPPVGTQTTARSLGRRPGGSTANVGRALATAGHSVHLVAQAGTDELGDALLAELATHGVDTTHVVRRGECTPEALIFVDRTGERTIFVIEQDCSETVPTPHDAIANADGVFVGTFTDYTSQLPAVLRSSQALVVTAVPSHSSAADWCADVVIGSVAEFPDAWAEAPYEPLREKIGDRLQWVVVTQGEKGARAHGRDTVEVIPSVETAVRDATGAGDCFTAGMMHGLLQDHDIVVAGTLGAHWAAAALDTAQSVPPPWVDLQLGDPSGDWPALLAAPMDGPAARRSLRRQ